MKLATTRLAALAGLSDPDGLLRILSAETMGLGATWLAPLFRDDHDPRFLAWYVQRLRGVEHEGETGPARSRAWKQSV